MPVAAERIPVDHEPTIDCRICGGKTFVLLDLGHHPFANALVSSLHDPVKIYPLVLLICRQCSAAQLSYCADSHELYDNYNYITPVSGELTAHYGKILDFLKGKGFLSSSSRLLEIGSNIGRFLEFVSPHVRSVTGVDPASNVAAMANQRGISTLNSFFNSEAAQRLLAFEGRKSVIVARHCFAHNEKPWRMLEGVQILLSDEGTLIIENAYFLDTMVKQEFDQVYHEHMYYYSVRSISEILKRYGMILVDVMHSAIHGGTMTFVAKLACAGYPTSEEVKKYLESEKDLHQPGYYADFRTRLQQNKEDMIRLLLRLKSEGKSVHAYGASAKSTTLFNYYGIRKDLVPMVVDSTPTKQGKYIPLANIKVISEEEAMLNPPDYYLLTIWNYKDEIIKKVRSWGNHKTKFILPHPKVEIVD